MRPCIALTTAAVILGPAIGSGQAQVALYETFKSEFFVQSNDVSMPSSDLYSFVPRLTVKEPTDVTNVSVVAPNNSLALTTTDGLTYSASPAPLLTKAQLDSAYPNSIYTFFVAGGTLGSESGSLDIPPDNYPNAVPQFVGGTFSRLQNLNVHQPNELTWNGFGNSIGANTPLTFLTIYDQSGAVVYETQGSNSLTQVLLPAGALLPSTTYQMDLAFSNRQVQSVGAFGGTFTSVAFDYRNDFSFTTSVPEPSNVALASIGVLMLLSYRRRK
jgi:hypothetical protein